MQWQSQSVQSFPHVPEAPHPQSLQFVELQSM
jgi:hypothetical protein